jgi:hypothetical protein
MKHNLIKTDNYLLVVDDSQIKVDDWVYNPFGDCPISVGDIEDDMLYVNTEYSKIISHLPLNGAPVLDGVPLLPPLPKEDDVEKLAEQYVSTNYPHYINQKEKAAAIEDVCWGYNKAKEKYKYTEEDMIEFANFKTSNLLKHHDEKGMYLGTKKVLELWKSLQHHPKYPIAFECEMEVGDYGDKNGLRKFVKTITNFQGKTEWVGKYVWE